MKDYPNREALRKAHDIYRDVMRDFVMGHLKQIKGIKPEETLRLILKSLPDPEQNDNPKEWMDINNFAVIIRNHDCWNDTFSKTFGSLGALDIRSMTGVIGDARKLWAHPGTEDIDSEDVRTELSLVAKVLGGINRQDAKEAVETIRDQLFSDEPEEHPAEAENAELRQKNTELKQENTELKSDLDNLREIETVWTASEKQLGSVSEELKTTKGELADTQGRLGSVSKKLKAAEEELANTTKGKGELESRLAKIEVENTELKKQCETTRHATLQEIKEAEKAAYEKGYEDGRNTSLTKLATVVIQKAALEDRLERMEADNAEMREDLTRIEETNQLGPVEGELNSVRLKRYVENFKTFMEKSHLEFDRDDPSRDGGSFIGYKIRPNNHNIWLSASVGKKTINAGLRVRTLKSFETLKTQKEDIQPCFHEDLQWTKGGTIFHIQISRSDMNPMSDDWDEQFYFLRTTLETLDLVFRDHVANLD